MVDDESVDSTESSSKDQISEEIEEPVDPPKDNIEGKSEEEDKKEDDVKPPPEESLFDDLYETLFGKSWAMWIGCIILSVLSIGLFMISGPWGSSGGILNWGQNLYNFLGFSSSRSASNGLTPITEHKYAMLSILMLIGAFGSALMAKEFAIRVPPKGELVKGLFGGILMGIGCVIGMGCTIGNFYSGWAALSGGGLIFTLGLFIGVFIAVKYLLWEMEKTAGKSSGKGCTYLGASRKRTSLQPLAGIIVLAFGFMLIFQYDTVTEKVMIGFVIVGLIIGFVLQRSRFCIVRTLRETFLTGDSKPTEGLIAGILVGLFGFSIIKIFGIGSETAMVASNFWVPAIVGGIVFGLGMTIAGGCTVGATWRAGEGQVKLWLALIGIVIFAPITAEYIRPAFLDMLPGDMHQRVFLPETFEYGGAILVMILILFIWYLFVKWNEKTGKLTAI